MKGTVMKKLWIAVLMILFLVAGALPASAAAVGLKWDPPDITTDVVGYQVHWGTASRVYTQSVDVGNVLTYSVKALPDGIYYFAVTAYNAAKYQSVYSNEIRNQPDPAKNLMLVGEMVVNIKAGNVTFVTTTAK
jgi:hypothetical protein